ncbi:MAG: DNA gyrase C-terminal beta-propeller domain-containing protein, partial [Solirubrobacteraceae bacterium]
EFEQIHGRDCIIVKEIPYQVNKSDMISRTADLIKEEKLEGISEIRDESDRTGMRVVYVLKSDAIPNIVLNKLYKYTQLQTSFSVNNIALVKGRPMQLNLKDLIVNFVEHRHEVVVRRTKYDLRKAEERSHILEGLLIALDNLDAVIKLIRASKTTEEARDGLISTFSLSELQARAILEMRLQRLTGLERDKIKNEFEELQKTIAYFKEILGSEELRMKIIKEELFEVKEKFGDERRTIINYAGGEFSIEDIIPDEEVVVTISHLGYIKRTSLTEYKTQSRGGVGNKGATSRDGDFLEYMVVATNHQYMLFFTEKGKCFWLKVYEIPEGAKTAKGRAIQNLINIEPTDKVKTYIRTSDLNDPEYTKNNYVIMCTASGIVKKTALNQYARPRSNGINAITIREGDQLLVAKLTTGNSFVMIATKFGKAIRFEETKVRSSGRTASGVKGISFDKENDEVIGMITLEKNDGASVLVVSEKGYGKRSDVEEYRITNRGGKGVKTINVTEKTGQLIAIQTIKDDNDLMIINKSGVAIRMPAAEMRVMGRATQGVRLINLKGKDEIAAIAKVDIDKTFDDENDSDPDVVDFKSLDDSNEE